MESDDLVSARWCRQGPGHCEWKMQEKCSNHWRISALQTIRENETIFCILASKMADY